MLKKWEELPYHMRTEAVRPYYDKLNKKKSKLFLKRVFDLVVSFIMLVLLSPLFLILAVLIKADSNGPVFYSQIRITKYGSEFRIFKFRTMVTNADRIGSLVTSQNDNRITHIGRKLRKYRLDELPQLINIFRGDMSFVGTRPEVPKYVAAYKDEWYATLLLPAGVTSGTSIKFKDEDRIIEEETGNGKTVDEAYTEKVLPQKMKYNLEAFESIGSLNDIKIMLQTVISVIK